jgi:hypothetical protein
MLGFFQTIIKQQLEAGALTDQQAEVIGTVIGAMPEADRNQLQAIVEAQPSSVMVFFNNILEKAEARATDTIDAWKKVVDDESKAAQNLP